MSTASDQVVAGFLKLTEADQRAAVKVLIEYVNGGIIKRGELKTLHEMKTGMDLGPLDSNRCPCCGR